MARLFASRFEKLKLTNTLGEHLRCFWELVTRTPRRGPLSETFEKAFAAAFLRREAVILPHARTAVHFFLEALKLAPGDEVLMTPLTIADMVNSIHTAGLKPVFVEMEPGSCNFDMTALEQAITPRAKVLLITHLCGIAPDMDALAAFAARHGLIVLEDVSQGQMAAWRSRPLGAFGAASVFSLTNFKLVPALFGGMLLTDDAALAARLRALRAEKCLPPKRQVLLKHLTKNLLYGLLTIRPVYNLFTYYVILHLEKVDPLITYRLYTGNIKAVLGETRNSLYDRFPEKFCHEFSDPQARLGMKALGRMIAVGARRRSNGELLREVLSDVPAVRLPTQGEAGQNVYWRFPVYCENVIALKTALVNGGFDAAPPYLVLCSDEPAFEPYRRDLPVARWIKTHMLVVEVHEGMGEADMRRMAKVIQEHCAALPALAPPRAGVHGRNDPRPERLGTKALQGTI